MSELSDIIKEMLVGDGERIESNPARENLEEAVGRYDRRMKTVRALAWTQVALMTAGFVWSIVSFFSAPDDATPKQLILYSTVFLFTGLGTWMGKLMIFYTQHYVNVMKEVKRTQLMVVGMARRD